MSFTLTVSLKTGPVPRQKLLFEFSPRVPPPSVPLHSSHRLIAQLFLSPCFQVALILAQSQPPFKKTE